MSRSNRTNEDNLLRIIKDESGWADFFITRAGLILFTSVLLLAAFKVYPMFQERDARAYLDAVASDITSKIEAVDSTTISGYKYSYVFNEKNKNVEIEISTEYVVARGWERELIHAETMVTHVYPPNSRWSNSSDLRAHLSTEFGKNGDASSPLNFTIDKAVVDSMFDAIRGELAQNPFRPDLSKPLIIEKIMIYYDDKDEIVKRDYVLIYQ